MPVLLDDFPDRTLTTALRFPEEVFDGEPFTVTEVGRRVIVAAG